MTIVSVYIPLSSETNLGEMMIWAKNEGIDLVKATPRNSENAFGRAMIYGFAFEFSSEEDAVAFKLRWL